MKQLARLIELRFETVLLGSDIAELSDQALAVQVALLRSPLAWPLQIVVYLVAAELVKQIATGAVDPLRA